MFSCHIQMATQTMEKHKTETQDREKRARRRRRRRKVFVLPVDWIAEFFMSTNSLFLRINWYTKRFTFVLFTTSFLSTSLFTKRSHQAVLLDSWKAVWKFIYTRQQSILIVVSVRQFFFTCHFFPFDYCIRPRQMLSNK